MLLFRRLRGLIDWLWALVQPVLRFLGWLFVLITVIALVADYTAWQQDAETTISTLGGYWRDLSPASLAATEAYLDANGVGWLWAHLFAPLLALPVWLTLGLVAALFMFAGRTRDRLSIYAN
ncbi:MAG: hypothetical protein AAFV26_02680 [Pseudomonadota bacterium]